MSKLAILEGLSGFGAARRGRKRKAKKSSASKSKYTRAQVRKAFGKAAKDCRVEAPKNYGSCMRREMKSNLRK